MNEVSRMLLTREKVSNDMVPRCAILSRSSNSRRVALLSQLQACPLPITCARLRGFRRFARTKKFKPEQAWNTGRAMQVACRRRIVFEAVRHSMRLTSGGGTSNVGALNRLDTARSGICGASWLKIQADSLR
eukprot:SAG11_NODE_3044_length_2734_cov_24.397723_6_plen_132_part_00